MGRKQTDDPRQLILFDLPADVVPSPRREKPVRKSDVVDLVPVEKTAAGDDDKPDAMKLAPVEEPTAVIAVDTVDGGDAANDDHAIDDAAVNLPADPKNEPTFEERAKYSEFERLRRTRNRFTGIAATLFALIIAINFDYARVTNDAFQGVKFNITSPDSINGVVAVVTIALSAAAIWLLVLTQLKLQHSGPYYAEVPYPTSGRLGRFLHYFGQALILSLLILITFVTWVVAKEDMWTVVSDVITNIGWLFQDWGPRVRRDWSL